ncbi:MAG TPA: tRNA (guanosine(37)-N1)-methyltransferase TrmD [Acidobacteriota bacterium]|jgi:tRNA (guanine37-N1)-methyltransferase|nr:tRNA (guanosine(37)-N1)-methyltransferase TrmD [Acidobacteriota bacterium]HNT18486.1 tRNA (guanosine(37)-N1)-methyltransferase TrmD [Acidobacteriota bacterium]HPA26668.1 tRNA (guanosine(37)-N1)-methyltransferase TrmD [Acidobacteriota bacterium]HQO19413.1 tRNA (guanosine(37)-N1)-methyltransferase TrmD [Acidobacteriota bacterium]HQQ46149.1 tRNA (guanosine(37)-N1)-methyltransferase TrmD [Acidobacteriota bacterium]
MRIDVLTLFPEMFAGPINSSIISRASRKGLVEIRLHNFRAFAKDRHHTVDDTPYGGGAGMVLKPEPIFAAVQYLREKNGPFPLIYLSPKGKVLDQRMVERWSKLDSFALLCGRYEGVDQRVVDSLADEEVSLGDFVLSGGEPAALAVIDAVVRLIPGALGDEESALDESFTGNLLEYPHYTKPRSFMGREVPEVLLSGNHGEIKKWREKSSIEITMKNRKDLLDKKEM